jgi:hypothetical protein
LLNHLQSHEQGLLGKCGKKIMVVPKAAVHIAAAHTKIMPPNTLIQTVLSRYTMYNVLGLVGVAWRDRDPTAANTVCAKVYLVDTV